MGADTNTRILIVDDDPAVRATLRRQLEGFGFADLDEAVDGTEALEKLSGGGFGLVVSDWDMKPMNGIELVRRMRAEPALTDIPFLMATAEGGAETVVAARRAGASGFVRKPFTPETLKAKLTGLLGDS